jgi:hypothetical protein
MGVSMPKDSGKFSVTLTAEDDTKLATLRKEYQGMARGTIARILLHYAIAHADEAMGLPAKEALRKSAGDGPV